MKKIIFKIIKYWSNFVFLLILILIIDWVYFVQTPIYLVTKEFNIRSGPSVKDEIVKNIESLTWHVNRIYVQDNSKGWQQINNDFFGKEIMPKYYIYLDGNYHSTYNINRGIDSYLDLFDFLCEYNMSKLDMKFDFNLGKILLILIYILNFRT